jgi:diguanylate cyclase (GGDEF)-like protein
VEVLMRSTSAAHRHQPRWARELLPVRVAIGMWITQALIGPLYLALPEVSQRHAGAVWICSAVALGWAVTNSLIPSDPRLEFLYPVGGGMAIASVAVLVASTGGAASPLRASQLFFVVFAAWFMSRRLGILMLSSATAATLLPLIYDAGALEGSRLGWTIMLFLTFLVVGITIMAARAELEKLRDRARRESLRDPLTGLANRRALKVHFQRIEHSRRVADAPGFVLIDLDDFKQINTSHGHAGGDRALQLVADALRGAVREQDLVARIGGDEFAIVVHDTGADELLEIAERAIDHVAAAASVLALDGVTLTASAGVAMPADGASSLESLFSLADVALGEVKAHGKGRVQVAEPGRSGGVGPTAPALLPA